MKQSTFLFVGSLIVVLMGGRVIAQGDCIYANFQNCLNIADDFLSSTCGPLQKTNSSLYNDCLCYNDVNRGLCYKQCPNNSTLQAQYSGGIQPKITADCGAAQLNPSALPSPAPWQTAGLLPSSLGAFPTVSGGNTTTPTPSGNSSGSFRNDFVHLIVAIMSLAFWCFFFVSNI